MFSLTERTNYSRCSSLIPTIGTISYQMTHLFTPQTTVLLQIAILNQVTSFATILTLGSSPTLPHSVTPFLAMTADGYLCTILVSLLITLAIWPPSLCILSLIHI